MPEQPDTGGTTTPPTPIADVVERIRAWVDHFVGDTAVARRDIRALLAELDRLRSENERLEAIIHDGTQP